jgi:predicted nuclease of predicted toxin-antitoxin system
MPNIRILLDNNVPVHLIPLLRPHEAVHAATMGWAAIGNGDLIRAAQQAGFAAMMTCDQNIQHQQRLAGQPLAFLVLTTTHWPTIRDNLSLITDAIDQISPGGYVTLTLPRPPRVRRPYNPKPEC